MSEKARYKMVTVKSELFEGEITLPEFDRVPTKVIRKLVKNDLTPLFDFIEENAPEESLAVLDEIAFGDFDKFLEDWTGSSDIPGPKSEKSTN